MNPIQQFLQAGPAEGLAFLVLGFVVYVLVCLVPLAALLYGVYFLLTLPLRRNERARFFLDLLELGLKEGRTPEATIADAAASHDPDLGLRFQQVAAQVQGGRSLSQALQSVPRLLPPQLTAMLATGERIGDVGRVLPACRLLLRDGLSQVRGALNYLLILIVVATPFTTVIPIILRVKVMPAFRNVFEGMMEGTQLPLLTRVVLADESLLTLVQVGVFSLFWLATLGYLGGPRLRQVCQIVFPGAADRFLYCLPWRRKRLQRDFSALLAVLLDAEVPESEAVSLAANATANLVMQRRAQRVCARLNQGVKLPEAIAAMDDSGELHWRLANALRRASGFTRALAGWHEALDAKAFQLEQAAAQLATTFLVLFNGFIVACIVLGMFLALIQLLNQATLW